MVRPPSIGRSKSSLGLFGSLPLFSSKGRLSPSSPHGLPLALEYVDGFPEDTELFDSGGRDVTLLAVLAAIEALLSFEAQNAPKKSVKSQVDPALEP